MVATARQIRAGSATLLDRFGCRRRRSGPTCDAGEGEDRATTEEEIHAARAGGEPRSQNPAPDPPLPPSLLDPVAAAIAEPCAGPRLGSTVARRNGRDYREHTTSTVDARGPCLGDWLSPLGPLLGSATTMARAEARGPRLGERPSLASSHAPLGESGGRAEGGES